MLSPDYWAQKRAVLLVLRRCGSLRGLIPARPTDVHGTYWGYIVMHLHFYMTTNILAYFTAVEMSIGI